MIKDTLEVVLKTAGDMAQGYVRERFPNKSTDAERRRLLMVMGVGTAIGVAVIVIVVVRTA